MAKNPLNENLTENDIKKAVIDYLQYSGWMVLRINSGGMSSEYTYKRGQREGQTVKRWLWFVIWFVLGLDPQKKGCFDTIAIKDGLPPLAVDTKKPGEVLTDEQELFADQWRKHGGIAIVASSIDDLVLGLMEALAE